MPKPIISALGCYVPPRLLTNADLERMVETTHEWIVARTGIVERHIAEPEVATSDLAVEAAQAALAQRGLAASELDAILVCTVTPDMLFPSTACLVQHRLGAKGTWGFDLMAACSSFLYGLTTAAHLVIAGTHRRVMVIGADTMTRIVDYTDRATCVLFGDGAGAMLVEAGEDDRFGMLDFLHDMDGSGAAALEMPAGGSRMPASVETVQRRLHVIRQDGPAVFKYAVRRMYEVCRDLLARNQLTAKDVAVLIPHQANRRIITATADRLGLEPEQVLINIDRYGNTTNATIPLAMQDAIEDGKVKRGDLVLFATVGAGYTVGASLWHWAY